MSDKPAREHDCRPIRIGHTLRAACDAHFMEPITQESIAQRAAEQSERAK